MSELVDLVDPQGRVAERGVRRADAGRYPGLHLQIVIVVVVNDLGKVLIHRRSLRKSVNPGDIDHVCGVVSSGETPLQAALREAQEELGVSLARLHDVQAGVNEYRRYRWLMVGETSQEPRQDLVDPDEVCWVGADWPSVLLEENAQGSRSFVAGFFEDLALALAELNK